MLVTMEQVLNQLGRDEPEYEVAAQLGPEALPHLITLIQGENPALAVKAASLAGMIKSSQSAAVLKLAAQDPRRVVRVAAAASAGNLSRIPTALAMMLLDDSDAGVRKWTLKSLENQRPAGLTVRVRRRLEEITTDDPDSGLREHARLIIDKLP